MCQLSHYLRDISAFTKEVQIAPNHSSFLFHIGCGMDLYQYSEAWSFLILKLFFSCPVFYHHLIMQHKIHLTMIY